MSAIPRTKHCEQAVPIKAKKSNLKMVSARCSISFIQWLLYWLNICRKETDAHQVEYLLEEIASRGTNLEATDKDQQCFDCRSKQQLEHGFLQCRLPNLGQKPFALHAPGMPLPNVRRILQCSRAGNTESNIDSSRMRSEDRPTNLVFSQTHLISQDGHFMNYTTMSDETLGNNWKFKIWPACAIRLSHDECHIMCASDATSCKRLEHNWDINSCI